MHKLDKLMAKKKKPEMDPMEKEAKMSVIKQMMDLAHEAMGEKIGGLKKVTVASDSPEGIKAGLELAKHKIGDLSEKHEDDGIEEFPASEEESAEHEASENPEEEMSEHELDAKLEELMAKKKALSAKKMV